MKFCYESLVAIQVAFTPRIDAIFQGKDGFSNGRGLNESRKDVD